MAPIILYHYAASTNSRGVLWTIRYLGLDVEIKETNLLKKEQFDPEFLKLNPQHVIPTIIDDDFVLWESRSVAGYLVDAKAPGNSLYPTDLRKRAIVNQRLYYDLGTLYTRLRAIAIPAIYSGKTKISEDKRKLLNDAFEFVNIVLEGNDYIAGGSTPTIADIFTCATTSTAVHCGYDIGKYPNIVAWYERCKQLTGFEENDVGAKQFGDKVKAALEDKL